MSKDPAAMTAEEVKLYREAVATLVATMTQRLRNYPLPDEVSPNLSAAPLPPERPHE